MATEIVKGPASYFPSIEQKYGKPIDYWLNLLLRPDEVSSCIAHPTILEVADHPLRSFVQHRHVLVGRLA